MSSDLNSALYVGQVQHRRHHPHPHQFRYRLYMLYLDLDELDQVFARRYFWSTQKPALARFDRRDHSGDPSQPLTTVIRNLVERSSGQRPLGRICLLTHLRYFGYCFNPISIYYCFDRAQQLQAMVAEVTNTPWGERICYVLPAPYKTQNTVHHFTKALHVSPFMPMDLNYEWRSNTPAARLFVHMNVRHNKHKLFDASLSLQRQPINTANLARALLRFPAMTAQVIVAIHWQALRLWLKRVPLFTHHPTQV